MLEATRYEKPDKKDSKALSKQLREELFKLQQDIKKAQFPVMIVFEGFGGAGKGDVISSLISELDPRLFEVISNFSSDCPESEKPFFYRYWRDIPSKGTISILNRSWYQETVNQCFDDELSKKQLEKRYSPINTFERQLSDDGYLIIKIFLNIDKKEQHKRFEKLLSSDVTSWRVNQKDIKHNKNFDRYSGIFDALIENTSTVFAPWHVVDSTDKSYAKLEALRLVVNSINARISLNATGVGGKITAKVIPEKFEITKNKKLCDVDLMPTLDEEKYEKELKKQQEKLNKLQNIAFVKRVPVIIAFEGWDAAGKGGAIRRVSSALDPRGYDAVPIAAPQGDEAKKHYLWRFWNHIPSNGSFAIFDRTWYGRVMVEKIEKFTDEKRCNMAYQEINEFEKELYDSGMVILKFWLHISKDEQEKRFNDRQSNPDKQWKITDEDWRNREKWDLYEQAVDEMIEKTSTNFAPWNIIEGNDKKYARVKVLKIINKALEKRLIDD